MENTDWPTADFVITYSSISADLIEPTLILRESRKQKWDRVRAEEQRLDALSASNRATYPWNNVLQTLPMSYDMEIEWDRITRKLRRQAQARKGNKRSRFTNSKNDELKVEEIVSEPAYVPKRKFNPVLDGCRSIEEYEPLNKIDEGSYGIVFRAREKATSKIYAIKKVKLEREKEGFPITALREITLMMKIEHQNIVKVKEVVFGSTLDKVYMVMEYIEHEIKSLVQQSFESMSMPKVDTAGPTSTYCLSTVEIKWIMRQLLKGVQHMHNNYIVHRDLKTSNLLINNNGIVKICDFGLARIFAEPPTPCTDLVVTLWYRAPELLLGANVYSGKAVDMWSVGCIMAELLLKEPIFMGNGELDQLDKIFKMLGTPTDETWKGWRSLKHAKLISAKKGCKSKLRDKFPKIALEDNDMYLTDTGLDLLSKMLTFDPEKRITAKDALGHLWFKEYPLGCEPAEMPTMFPTNEIPRDQLRKRRMKSLDKEQQKQREELYENDYRFEIHQNLANYEKVQ